MIRFRIIDCRLSKKYKITDKGICMGVKSSLLRKTRENIEVIVEQILENTEEETHLCFMGSHEKENQEMERESIHTLIRELVRKGRKYNS